MAQPTTSSSPSAPKLLPILFDLLHAHRSAVRQERTFWRLCALSLGHLLCFGRHTVSQLLVALGLGAVDWSGFYRVLNRARLEYELLCWCLLQEVVPAIMPADPLVVAVDGVQLARHSQRMPGTSWQKQPATPPFFPGIHRAQRFVDLAVLLPVSADGYSRAVPVRWVPAFPEKAVRPDGLAPRKEWEAALDELHWLRAALAAADRADQPVLSVADGHYSNQHVWTELPARTFLVARCAKNRNLFALPQPESGKRGRPRQYGDKAPKPADWLGTKRGWRQARLPVRGRTIRPQYRVEGPYVVKGAPDCPLFLLVVRGSGRRPGQPKRKRRNPTYWLINAIQAADGTWTLPFPAEQLLAWAWQRWEIEVTHRELKSGFGLGEQQQWSGQGALLAPQWTVWTYSVLVLTGYRAWGLGPSPQPPPGRWWPGGQRWSLNRLWQALRAELWEVGEFRPVWTRTTDNWWKMTDWLAARDHAITGAERA